MRIFEVFEVEIALKSSLTAISAGIGRPKLKFKNLNRQLNTCGKIRFYQIRIKILLLDLRVIYVRHVQSCPIIL